MVEARKRIKKLEKIEQALCMHAAKWLQLEEWIDSWIIGLQKKIKFLC